MDAVVLEVVLEQVKKSNNYKKVMSIIKNNRLVVDRIQEVGSDNVEEKWMSAGVGKIQVIKGFVYVQIGYGRTNRNCALAVEIGHIREGHGSCKPYFLENDLSL